MHEKMGSPIVTIPMRIVIATVEMVLTVLMVVSAVDLLIVGRTGVREWELSWNVMVPIHWYTRATPPKDEFLRGNTNTNVLMYRTTQKKKKGGGSSPSPIRS